MITFGVADESLESSNAYTDESVVICNDFAVEDAVASLSACCTVVPLSNLSCPLTIKDEPFISKKLLQSYLVNEITKLNNQFYESQKQS